MTRKKVKLAFIVNDATRKATFKKRKKGLIKKVNELSTLCDVKACAIVYSPYDSAPEVWPPSIPAVKDVLTDFKMLSEVDQKKRMFNQESFLDLRIKKTIELIEKQRRDNLEIEMREAMFKCLVGDLSPIYGFDYENLNNLKSVIDQHLRDVNRRLEILTNSLLQNGESSSAAAAAGSAFGAVTNAANAGSAMAMAAPTGSYFNFTQHNHHHHQQQQVYYPVAAPNVDVYGHNPNLNLNQQQIHYPNWNQNQNQIENQNQNQNQQVWMMNNGVEQMSVASMDDTQFQYGTMAGPVAASAMDASNSGVTVMGSETMDDGWPAEYFHN